MVLANEEAMLTVGQILQHKGVIVWSIRPEATVYEALEMMAEKNIGAVLVMDEGRLLGIFTERDYARKLILHGKSSRDTQVSEIMTGNLTTVTLQTNTQECMNLMTDGHFRHLPVLEAGSVAGLVSIGDVVKAIITEQEFTIQQLERYITGERR